MTTIQRITSPTNERVKEAVALHRTSERNARGAALLEGWNLVEEAVRSRCPIIEVFVGGEEDGEAYHRARQALARAAAPSRDSPPPLLHLVSEQVLHKLATTQSPQPIVAIINRPPAPPLDELLRAARSRPASAPPALWCGLWRPNDPGNLGAIARTTEAAGGDGLLAIADEPAHRGVDPWNPKALRASAGALLRLPCVEVAAADLAVLAPHFVSVALDGAGPADFYALRDLASAPVLLLLGNETHGLPSALLAGATHHAKLPHAGPTESLNVAAAAAVALFEITRQRRRPS